MPLLAIETAYRNRRTARIPYAAPTREEVKNLLVPTIEKLFVDCPPSLRPHEIKNGSFHRSASTLTWPWGAQIVLAGVDINMDRLRGPAAVAAFLTEAGFMADLEYIWRSVLLAQLLTEPDGFAVMGSTPSTTPAHPWVTSFIPAAKSRGMYAHRRTADSPRISDVQLAGFAEEMGGEHSVRARREMDADESLVDTEHAVLPEFAEAVKWIVRDEIELPDYGCAYGALDPGFTHPCAGLFSVHDFKRAAMLFLGDFCESGKNTRAVAELVNARELQLLGVQPQRRKGEDEAGYQARIDLAHAHFYADTPQASALTYWGGQDFRQNMFRRVSDTDPRMIADLKTEHGLLFQAAQKDDLETAINFVRLQLSRCIGNPNPPILIHRRCTHLISQCTHAIWNKQRTKFAESGEHGHFDVVACLIYLMRHVVWNKNPYPPHGVHIDPATMFVPTSDQDPRVVQLRKRVRGRSLGTPGPRLGHLKARGLRR